MRNKIPVILAGALTSEQIRALSHSEHREFVVVLDEYAQELGNLQELSEEAIKELEEAGKIRRIQFKPTALPELKPIQIDLNAHTYHPPHDPMIYEKPRRTFDHNPFRKRKRQRLK